MPDPTAPLDLNNVPLEGLLLLPGIDLAAAKRIVEEREKRRGFETVEEIEALVGLAPHMTERLRRLVVVNPMPSLAPLPSARKRLIDF